MSRDVDLPDGNLRTKPHRAETASPTDNELNVLPTKGHRFITVNNMVTV